MSMQECSTCHGMFNNLTSNQIRKSSDDGCTSCTLIFEEISLFILDPKPKNNFFLSSSWVGLVIVVGESYGVDGLDFTFPSGNIQVPITSFSVERHFVDYSDRQSIQRVARLVDDCNEHGCLEGQTPKLPKRVIDVGSDILKLYCPMPNEEAKYTILSHCWGGPSPFITLRNNIVSRKKGFAIDELPMTFRDAVVLTRKLGIRYLWLDSMCIVQQDRDDWDSEGQKMADYYSNAYLTIAAARAANSRAGFLHLTERRRICTIHCESYGTQFDCIVTEPNVTEFEARACEVGNPLYTRGWVFQEMLISPRVISFGAKELEWYCRKHNWCECIEIMPDKYRGQGPHSPHWQNNRKEFSRPDCQQWTNIVAEFTRRNLTFDSDRLPAISALATRFNETIEVSYLAGIWKTDPFIWKQLLWTAGGWTRNSFLKPGPPSWSWASVNTQISYANWLYETPSNDSVSLLDANTQLRGTSPYGEVTGGSLRVRGVLIRVQLDITLEEPVFPESEPEYSWSVLSTDGVFLKELEKVIKKPVPYLPLIEFSPDTPLELAPHSDCSRLPTEQTYQRSSRWDVNALESTSGVVYFLRFLPTYREPSAGPAFRRAWMLVLRCVDIDAQSYERIGLAEVGIVEGNRQYFCRMEQQELTIV